MGKATINIPLVKDKLAIRLVGFAAEDAGFIDNVLATTPYAGTKDNADLVEEDFNSAEWTGARASIKWLMNDAWSTTVIYNYSKSTINGFNDFDPTAGDLKTTKFHEESWDDDWQNVQLTVEGDLGFAQLTSSLAYFDRSTAANSAPNCGCALMPVPTAVPPCASPVSRGSADSTRC
jgi:hypothetical protein